MELPLMAVRRIPCVPLAAGKTNNCFTVAVTGIGNNSEISWLDVTEVKWTAPTQVWRTSQETSPPPPPTSSSRTTASPRSPPWASLTDCPILKFWTWAGIKLMRSSREHLREHTVSMKCEYRPASYSWKVLLKATADNLSFFIWTTRVWHKANTIIGQVSNSC